MKHIAAYLLLQLGGNTSPSAGDIKTLLEAGGVEADQERLEKLIKELEGKDINEVRWLFSLVCFRSSIDEMQRKLTTVNRKTSHFPRRSIPSILQSSIHPFGLLLIHAHLPTPISPLPPLQSSHLRHPTNQPNQPTENPKPHIQLIAEGSSKLASVPSGGAASSGGAGGAAAGGAAPAAAEEKAEEKKEEAKEEVRVLFSDFFFLSKRGADASFFIPLLFPFVCFFLFLSFPFPFFSFLFLFRFLFLVPFPFLSFFLSFPFLSFPFFSFFSFFHSSSLWNNSFLFGIHQSDDDMGFGLFD
jgi:ribosomal protein L12E/L44/L45/RPP1/RPP2